MPRFINPNPQFSDKNGSPLAFGSITFYESGTTTFKTTYSDPGLTTPNDNPVPLDAAGRAQTDIFYEGDASVILKDNNDVVEWQDDPVSSSNSSSFPEWNAGTSYQTNDVVKYNGDFYRAIAPSTNEIPTNQAFWSKILQTEEWNPNDTYTIDDLVVKNGIHYVSLVASNTTDPEINRVRWRASSTAVVINTDSGTSSEYVVNAATGFASQELKDGLTIKFVASNTNEEGATLNYDGQGAKSILDTSGNSISADVIEANQSVEVRYDSSMDSFILDNASSTNNVRSGLIDNPIFHAFRRKTELDVGTGALTWTRASTGSYKDYYGVIRSAAIDTAREEPNGWLIEGDSTNNTIYSEDFTNAIWIKTGSATIDSNVVDAPDLATTGDRFNSTATNEEVRQTVNFVDDGKYLSGSLFVKKDTASTARFRLVTTNGGTNQDFSAVFNFDTETFTETPVGATAYFEPFVNGWFRITMFFQTNSSGNTNFQLRLRTDDTGAAVFLWGAQQEESLPFSTSYIQTVASTVTRSADEVSIPLLDNITGVIEGDSTKVVTVSSRVSDGIYQIYSAEGSVNTSNDFSLRISGTQFQYRDSDVSTISLNTYTGNGDKETVSCVTKDGVMSISIQGRKGLDTTTNIIGELVLGGTITFGKTIGNSARFYGNLSDFRIYNEALNQNEIKSLNV